MKKHKVGELGGGEKSKKDKKNDGRDIEIFGNESGGENELIEVGKGSMKECGTDVEKKKKKKKKEKHKQEVGEDNGGYKGMENGNDDGKLFDIGGGRKHNHNVVEKVKGKKRKREKDKNIGSDYHVQEEDFQDVKGVRKRSVDGTYCSEMQNGKKVEALGQSSNGDVAVAVEKKRKKKRVTVEVDSGASQQDYTYLRTNETQEQKNRRGEGVKVESFAKDCEDSIQKGEKKKRKREKEKENDLSGATGLSILVEECTKGIANSIMSEEFDRDSESGSKGKIKEAKIVDTGSENPNPKKSKKKVRFSGSVQVFPPFDDKLVRGKRFSKEEDEIVKEAVYNYIEAHSLGDEGVKMVLNCKSYPEIKNCWKEIATSLPNRPHSSIYYRAQILFRRDEKRKWTEEEVELVQKFQEKYGNQWKVLADELGKHRVHVKDTWRRIRLKNLKKGRWSQEEYQSLFDLVNTDLSMKYYEEKKSKYGMLRDNIAWTAISDKLSTRSGANCCLKWYYQLTSSMVPEGVWADADDYRLIDALFQLDSSCTEDVDWDNLLDHRSGDVCQKRWNQMVLHIGDNKNRSFADQVEVLTKRYCPHLLKARETWDSKPVVP